MSLINFGSPSTVSSKSSMRRLGTAAPCASTTVAGTGTRCELTRTTSSDPFVLSFAYDFGVGRGITGGGGIAFVVCRCRVDGAGEGDAVIFFCRPDCQCVGRAFEEDLVSVTARRGVQSECRAC